MLGSAKLPASDPKTYKAEVDTAIQAIEADYVTKTNAKIGARGAARASMAAALQAWSADGDVVVFLRTFSGLPATAPTAGTTLSPAIAESELPQLDPVIAYAIAAANTAKADPQTLPAAAIAAQALSAAQARYQQLARLPAAH
jgi:hypothetical protein